ncbi:hypothetical protein BD769DRAFT_54331 [Suillus cothurnatus]|nr:hypothetical protein BD769DRAFT_54331 [Suillus cothurnatus]
MKHRKSRETWNEDDEIKGRELCHLRADPEESFPQFRTADTNAVEIDLSNRRWEDLASADSLVDIAKLHCNINVGEEIRNDFMKLTPEEITNNMAEVVLGSRKVQERHASQHAGYTVWNRITPILLRVSRLIL